MSAVSVELPAAEENGEEGSRKNGARRMARNRAARKFKVDRWILEPPKSCTENQDPGRTEQEGWRSAVITSPFETQLSSVGETDRQSAKTLNITHFPRYLSYLPFRVF